MPWQSRASKAPAAVTAAPGLFITSKSSLEGRPGGRPDAPTRGRRPICGRLSSTDRQLASADAESVRRRRAQTQAAPPAATSPA
ncbi:hypothetical protein, partial [Streptomyces caniscabiei]|uniref:hypothetical protein n=1 Tax=Streptomyces caniscabiei TaxID=2746961 RepID=UPI001F3C2D83